MKNNIVKDKTFDFAIRIVKYINIYAPRKKNSHLQVLRSGTSIGAMVREAEHAESKNDFIHKFAIAQKEANETVYWLELLKATGYLSEKEFENISSDSIAILKLITSILKTTKKQILSKQVPAEIHN